MKKYIVIFIMIASFVFTAVAKKTSSKNYDYLEKTGKNSVKINLKIQEQKGSIVSTSTRSVGETDIYTSKTDLSNLQWQMTEPEDNTDFTAKREDDHIVIKGKFKGEEINRKVKIDKEPWYQSLSFSLTTLAKSDQPSHLFWVLRPDTLKPIKMKARKLNSESIKIEGKQVEVEKIKVILTGFKSMFWHGLYWYRKSDGLFVKYEGAKGPPGTPITTITLTKEKETLP